MNTKSHLLPIPGQTVPSAVDESVTMDNTLSGKEMASRNRPEDLEWLQDAGLGLFIHWSLDAQLGCVISHSLVGASEDYTNRFYQELPRTLNPAKWDFDHLARLAASSTPSSPPSITTASAFGTPEPPTSTS